MFVFHTQTADGCLLLDEKQNEEGSTGNINLFNKQTKIH